MALPHPPKKDNQRFDDWMLLLYRAVLGGDTSEGGTSDHTQLSNLNSDSFSHPTSQQLAQLTGSGNTALHYHAADRDRANHTGTQTSATISDFAQAVQSLQSSSALEAQIFGR